MLRSPEDIDGFVAEYGFLPFFRCGVDGFSIEELTPDNLWFSDVVDGPWEWKGPVIALGNVAYGKFFNGKAGYVSLEWLPHLMNYRRSCMPLKKRSPEIPLLNAIQENESLLTHELKSICGYVKKRESLSPLEKAHARNNPPKRVARHASFDTLITRLQMATYVVVADFEYNYTRQGDRYGWGKARYTTPELLYAGQIKADDCSPQESLSLMLAHLAAKLPNAAAAAISNLIVV